MSKRAIWVESKDWVFYLGLAGHSSFTPFAYGDDEIEMRLSNVRRNLPEATLVEARDDPGELPWNEDQWRRATKRQ